GLVRSRVVAVMQIRIVRMLVQNPRVPVPVAMRLTRRRVWRVLMLVMDVVHGAMFMLERFMQRLVVGHLGEVQINDNAHLQRRAQESEGGCLERLPNAEDPAQRAPS